LAVSANSDAVKLSADGPRHFFFYGLLQTEELSAAARAVLPKLDFVSTATIPGRLYAISGRGGLYPALVRGPDAKGEVRGACFKITSSFQLGDLALLDAFEEYDPRAPETSEYLREALFVTLEGGTRIDAWAYVYNAALAEGAEPIPSGDFIAYLRSRR
jgi:hypothetical protein